MIKHTLCFPKVNCRLKDMIRHNNLIMNHKLSMQSLSQSPSIPRHGDCFNELPNGDNVAARMNCRQKLKCIKSLKGGKIMGTKYYSEGNAAIDMSHILLVEDEPSVANGLKMVLSDEGYKVDVAMTGNEALQKFRGNGFRLVVADIRLPDISGMDVVREVKRERPDTEVVVITGYPSVETAVESAKMGVRDYLKKPFTDDELLSAVGKALKEKSGTYQDSFLEDTSEGKLIQKREVLRALDLAAEDRYFWRHLMEDGSKALEGFSISSSAKAAVAVGDLGWINQNIGELTQKQLKYVLKRMEREAW